MNTSDLRIDESILSAQIRVMVEMVESIGSQPPVPWSGHYLVLFDQFNQRPVQKVIIQGGGAKLVVFPVLDLVKRWIHSPRLNHGVYIRLQSNYPEYEASVNVMVPSTGAATDNRPLLVVQTQTKPQKVDALLTLAR